MAPTLLADERLKTLLNKIAATGIEGAAEGLSMMIGQRISMTLPTVTVAPINNVPARVGGPETPVVGIYLGCGGEMGGHVMLILDQLDALHLVDLLFGLPEGTTSTLDDALARSALAEAGNMATSFFLNAIASTLGVEGRPTPPAVIVDMAGAILDIMLVTAGELGDEVLLFEAVFKAADRQLKLYFWMLPELAPLRKIAIAA